MDKTEKVVNSLLNSWRQQHSHEVNHDIKTYIEGAITALEQVLQVLQEEEEETGPDE